MQSVPIAQGRVSSVKSPSINSLGGKGDARIRVRHKEYIADVVSTTASGFTTTKFSVNPGLISTFPWLAKMASNYESYEFNALCFHYEPTCPSTNSGSVILAMDYDAADPAPATKTEAMSMHSRSRASPWQECHMLSDLKDLKKFGTQRYNRNEVLAPNLDIKTYDVGNLFVSVDKATVGTLGELHVSYDVSLMTPQLPDFTGYSAKVVSGAPAISDTQIWGDNPVVTGGLPITVVNNAISFLTTGEYLVEIEVAGTGLVAPTITASTATRAFLATVVGIGSVSYVASFRVQAIAGQNLITDFSGSSTVTLAVGRVAPYRYSLA